MSIDISKTFSGMAQAAEQSLEEDGVIIGSGITKVLNNNKQTLAELAQARAHNEINDEDFSTELAREKSIVEVEMIALEIANKAAVQKAVNAGMDVLANAVAEAI